MKPLSLLVLCLLLVAMAGCKRSKPLAQSTPPVPTVEAAEAAGEDYIELSKSGCLGPCSIYKLKVYRNGAAWYRAIEQVPRKGTFTGVVGLKELDQLWNAIDTVQKMNLEPGYMLNVMDVQLVKLEWRQDEQYHKVSWKHGEPRPLSVVAQHMDSIAFNSNWKPVAAPD